MKEQRKYGIIWCKQYNYFLLQRDKCHLTRVVSKKKTGPARERIARSTEAVSVLQPFMRLRERRHLPEGEGSETKEGVSESAMSTALSAHGLAAPSARNFSHAALYRPSAVTPILEDASAWSPPSDKDAVVPGCVFSIDYRSRGIIRGGKRTVSSVHTARCCMLAAALRKYILQDVKKIRKITVIIK